MKMFLNICFFFRMKFIRISIFRKFKKKLKKRFEKFEVIDGDFIFQIRKVIEILGSFVSGIFFFKIVIIVKGSNILKEDSYILQFGYINFSFRLFVIILYFQFIKKLIYFIVR